MTTTPRIFRNCALALPLVVLGACVVGGGRVGAEVAVGGAFAVTNFMAMAWIGSGFVREAAYGGNGFYAGMMVLKMAVALPLFVLLLSSLAPENVVMGLASVVLAVATTGVELALIDSDPGPELAAPAADPVVES